MNARQPTFEEPAIGWYVHLPFCRTKCGYCDFYSLPTIPELVDALTQALQMEVSRRAPARKVETVFFGGGTPTELPEDALDGLLSAVSEKTGAISEWTVEANPSSVSELKLDVLRRHGVTRLSLGAQSFNTDELATLDRLHDPAMIERSYRAARQIGFDNINLDLIYAIPGQTLDRWRDTLHRAIELGTDHLSCYALMYEPGTRLTRLRQDGNLVPCDEELEADMFDLTIDTLSGAGFEHYEISNFARSGCRCKANMIYWENREYLGIGPSAVSYLDGIRTRNIADVRAYVRLMQEDPDSVEIEREQLDQLERAGETAVQMLRLTDGIDIAGFQARTGLDPRVLFASAISRFSSHGLLEETGKAIRLTRRGLPVANRVMADFLAPGNGRTVPLTTL